MPDTKDPACRLPLQPIRGGDRRRPASRTGIQAHVKLPLPRSQPLPRSGLQQFQLHIIVGRADVLDLPATPGARSTRSVPPWRPTPSSPSAHTAPGSLGPRISVQIQLPRTENAQVTRAGAGPVRAAGYVGPAAGEAGVLGDRGLAAQRACRPARWVRLATKAASDPLQEPYIRRGPADVLGVAGRYLPCIRGQALAGQAATGHALDGRAVRHSAPNIRAVSFHRTRRCPPKKDVQGCAGQATFQLRSPSRATTSMLPPRAAT